MTEATPTVVDVPAELASVDVVQERFDAWWQGLDVAADMAKRFALEIAVVEIAANIVEHATRSDASPDRRFTLTLSDADGALTAVFRDNGLPAEIDLSAVTMADVDEESGRGLALAIAALDDLDYRRVDGQNIWTLTCRR